jgi:hypothetical protein
MLDIVDPFRKVSTKSGQAQAIAAVPSERRGRSVTTSQVQYEFLRDCLVRREEHRRRLGLKERRARHILVSIIAVFVLLLFGAKGSALTLAVFGTTMTLTLLQLIAIAPFLMTYLIVYAGTRAAREYRIEQEVWALDLELRRFGCPTSYSAVAPLRRFSASTGEHHGFLVWSRRLFNIHDFFLGVGVVLTYVVAAVQAWKLFSAMTPRSPLVVYGLLGYLAFALGIASYAIVASITMRQQRGKVFAAFLVWRDEEAAKRSREEQGEREVHPVKLGVIVDGQKRKEDANGQNEVAAHQEVRGGNDGQGPKGYERAADRESGAMSDAGVELPAGGRS